MDMNPVLANLCQQPIFQALNEEDVNEYIAPVIEECTYQAGEIVFRQGDQADYFYMIISGEFEVCQAGDGEQMRRVNLLYPMDFFGDVSFLYTDPDGYYNPRSVTVTALEESVIMRMSGEDLLVLRETFPEFALRMDRHAEEIDERTYQHFENQKVGEIVIYRERRHWVALVQRMIPVIVVAIIYLGILLAIGLMAPQGLIPQVVAVLSGILLIPTLIYTVWHVTDYLNDWYIVTDERIIRIEKTAWVAELRYEIPLSKVQNVTVDSPNPLEEWLGFGEMIVSTAAQKGALRLDFMRAPDLIGSRIIQEVNRSGKRLVQEDKDSKRRALARALGGEQEGNIKESNAPTLPSPPLPPLQRFINYFVPLTRMQEGNRIIWRKHPFILLWDSLAAWFAFIVALTIVLVVPFWQELTGGLLIGWSVGSVVVLALLAGWIWFIYEDWRNDRYILTESSILDEAVKPLGFDRKTRQASLDQIQDIQYEQTNPLQVWFNIGRVRIQTAGQEGQFTFDWVKDPRAVQSDISLFMQARKTQREREESESMRQEFLELLTLYDEENRAQKERPAQ